MCTVWVKCLVGFRGKDNSAIKKLIGNFVAYFSSLSSFFEDIFIEDTSQLLEVNTYPGITVGAEMRAFNLIICNLIQDYAHTTKVF